ncbi:MAG: hypothetical protein A2096_09495 [Spirochaetes bacterium GWF1_41_5]|nr:MAG: hypothetical protein A2096_09495 [Spirochaetes bacterium GWF1_41_5]
MTAALLYSSFFAQTRLPQVAILNFAGKSGVSAGEASGENDLFRSELGATRRYNILERAKMDTILKEQAFQQTCCTESECAVKIGQILNMQYMFVGTLMKLGSYIYLLVSMIR